MPVQHPFLQIVFGAGLHQADEHRGVFPDAGNLRQGFRGGVKDPGEGAEMGNQALGQGFDVGVGDGKGEQQFQQLVVLQGPGPALEKALPEAGPVAVIVGFFWLSSHLPSLLLRWLANCNYEKAKGGHLGPPRQVV